MAQLKVQDIEKILDGMAKGKDPLEIMRETERPQIDDTLAKAKAAIKQAQKVKGRHRCRVCQNDNCPHNEREDIETGKQFDLKPSDPRCQTGEY